MHHIQGNEILPGCVIKCFSVKTIKAFYLSNRNFMDAEGLTIAHSLTIAHKLSKFGIMPINLPQTGV